MGLKSSYTDQACEAGTVPILQGLNAPINDLSRGCNADEVCLMSIITAAQSIT